MSDLLLALQIQYLIRYGLQRTPQRSLRHLSRKRLRLRTDGGELWLVVAVFAVGVHFEVGAEVVVRVAELDGSSAFELRLVNLNLIRYLHTGELTRPRNPPPHTTTLLKPRLTLLPRTLISIARLRMQSLILHRYRVIRRVNIIYLNLALLRG